MDGTAWGEVCMLNITKETQIYLACGATDMRKSINGLCGIVQGNFELDPFEKAYFVFCNRQRNRLKILTWAENGFWIHFNRLEKGHFKWPESGEIQTLTLNHEELNLLIKSPGMEQKIKRKQLFCDR